MAAEAGHFANMVYFDQSGNFHLNGASWFDASENDVKNQLNGLTALTAAQLAFLAVVAGTVTASKALVVDAQSTLDALTVTTLTIVKENVAVGVSTAAAGNDNTNAAGLPAGTAEVYPTTAADDTKGVQIDAADKVTGRKLLIGNGVSNKILKVYGPTGAVINGAAANAAFSSASGKGVIAVCLSGAGNTWLMW